MEEINKIVKEHFKIPLTVDYNKDFLERFSKFEVKDTDVILCGFPKSGTTWSQEMVWLIGNNLDFEGAKVFVDERFPVLEHRFRQQTVGTEIPLYYSDPLTFVEQMKSPRFMKTHLAGSVFPKQIQKGIKMPKIIYVYRNIKDTCISTYYYAKNLKNFYTGDLEDFCKVFMAVPYTWGDFREHVLYFWERRNESNVLFLRYEDMIIDLPKEMKRVANFLGTTLSQEQIDVLTEKLSFASMKNNAAVNHQNVFNKGGFMRSGTLNGYKNELSQEMIDQFDSWMNQKIKGTDFIP